MSRYILRHTQTGKQLLVLFHESCFVPLYPDAVSLIDWGKQTGGSQDVEDLKCKRMDSFPAVVIDDGGHAMPCTGFCVYDGQSREIKIKVRDAASIRSEIIKSGPNRIQRKGEKNV